MVEEKGPDEASAETGDGASPVERPTAKVITLEVIHALLVQREHETSVVVAQQDALSAKIDAMRAEGDKRGAEQAASMTKLEGSLDATRNEVKNLAHRMTAAETEITTLKDGGAAVTRRVEDAKAETNEAINGAIEHVKKIDDGFAKVSSEVETVKTHVDAAKSDLDAKLQDVKENDEKQNKALAEGARVDRALCHVLGVDYKAVAADPGASGKFLPATAPKATLPSLARESQAGTIVAFITLLTVVGQLILKSCQ